MKEEEICNEIVMRRCRSYDAMVEHMMRNDKV
jgi:hypothetical protein